MTSHRFAPDLDCLEPRTAPGGLPNPTDPVLPPPGVKAHPIIIVPVPAPTPHLPPGTAIA